jgi:hypothetical protein
MMSFAGWSGQLEGTLGTGHRAGGQMERPTPALRCARQAYSNRLPTSQVASRIGVGSGHTPPIALQGQPTVSQLIIDDRHHRSLGSTALEDLSK